MIPRNLQLINSHAQKLPDTILFNAMLPTTFPPAYNLGSMTYTVLARKWRPKNFQEVSGQEHVLRALINALTQQRLHHAYLFSGTRGIGKTTIARILAKCLNCEAGITATPCGKCDTCMEIDSGTFIDLIEVDAASRTKVEDTRDLLDNVQYLPVKGRFKVYLIDEVHMLSGHSFNALLKTLEEPPEHVKFLLATTDPQRLPVTVLSRCLQFNLKALTPELIQQQLEHILKQENISAESEALYQLAIAANGSVRDALSLLDQAIAYGQGKILISEVSTMLGTIDTSKIFTLLEALINQNANAILATIAELAILGADFTTVCDDLLETLHRIALLQLAPDLKTTSWQNYEQIKNFSEQLTPENVQLYYQIAIIGKRDLPLAPSLRTGFEMLMLRMLAFQPDTITAPKVSTPSTAKVETKPIVAAITPQTKSEGVELLQQLQVTGPTRALLRHCSITNIGQDTVELLLEPNQAPLLNKMHEERVSKALSEHFGRTMKANIQLGAATMDTIASRAKHETKQKQEQALQSIQNDHTIKEFMNKFGATIVPNSVQAEK